MKDYENRSYLSAIEAAKFLGITVARIHGLARDGSLPSKKAASGQMRFDINELERFMESPDGHGRPAKRGKGTAHAAGTVGAVGSGSPPARTADNRAAPGPGNEISLHMNNTTQRILVKNSAVMDDLPDSSVHLMVTSPPYFNAKMYSGEKIDGDLGDIHGLVEWFEEIGRVWTEVYRVLQPGRKAFINIMNLPVRGGGTFRSLNLVGRTVDVCEEIGFIFKRDIVWHKTNGVKAHFGTYPYPGGILLNNMHEFILEFEKPAPKGCRKYTHVTDAQREASRLDKEFWLSLKNSDVWLMKPEKSGDRRSHIAPFPLELPRRLIKAYSFIGETVLDPFMGSGTALRAAAGLGRNGIGYEINPGIVGDALEGLKSWQTRLV